MLIYVTNSISFYFTNLLCGREGLYMCHCAHREIRGQLERIHSLLPTVSRDQIHVARL